MSKEKNGIRRLSKLFSDESMYLENHMKICWPPCCVDVLYSFAVIFLQVYGPSINRDL